MIKLSVIIPVYNVEKYIKKCLDSVFIQDVACDEYEVIVVDDGSPDNSMEIVKYFATEFKNLKIISQKNQGLSAARNAGMRIAKGEYIWFVDSDDWIEENCLQEIFKILNTYKAEVFVTPLKSVNETSRKIIKNSFLGCEDISFCKGIDFLKYSERITPIQIYIFNRIFMKKNDLEFKHGIFHEDLELAPRMLFFAKDVCLINKTFYCYLLRNSGSITSDFSSKKSEDLILIIKSLEDFVKKNKLNRFERQNIMFRKIGCLYSIISNFNNTDDYKIRDNFFKTYYWYIKRLSLESILTFNKRFIFYGFLLLVSHKLIFLYFNNKQLWI